MELQDPADSPQPGAMRHVRRERQRWPFMAFVAAGVLLSGVGVTQLITHQVAESQTDTQVERQIAALQTVTPTPSVSAAPRVQVPSSAATPAATPSVSVQPAPQQPTPVTKPAATPVSLTCQRADIIGLPILPLPPQADPGIVDPPETPKAAYWNPQWGKVGASSDKTALIQAHYAITEFWPFNKLSYAEYFDVGDVCSVAAADGSVATYRLETTVALTMEQWRADSKFGKLTGPNRGYDLILQACDAADYHVLKRLVGFKLVASS